MKVFYVYNSCRDKIINSLKDYVSINYFCKILNEIKIYLEEE